MRHYLLGCRTMTPSESEGALALAATRFPEVQVDHRYTAQHEDGLDLWVCQAPSEHHLRRWVEAAHLRVDLLQPVVTDPGSRP